MVMTVICLLTEKNPTSLRQIISTFNFSTQLCVGSISKKFDALESRQLSFKANMYGFSVDYSLNKSDSQVFNC